jgi:Arc/MetJ-type ribon-helix-helix transcriptional regulator
MTKRGRPPLAEEVRQVAFRLPSTLVNAIDAYVDSTQEKTPGLSVSRSDAVRMLLNKILEKEGFPPNRKKK